jgi:peptide deformylase
LATLPPMLPSEQMRAIGIRQLGDPILREVCRDFDLPNETADATALRDRLLAVAGEAMKLHTFTKGIGVAAPQIGVPRSASIVLFPDAEPLFLLNPHILSQIDDQDEQFEGCLSFFDVRGMVPRSLAIEVEHSALSGERIVTRYEHGMAHLIAHEIDHLRGVLYLDRMRPRCGADTGVAVPRHRCPVDVLTHPYEVPFGSSPRPIGWNTSSNRSPSLSKIRSVDASEPGRREKNRLTVLRLMSSASARPCMLSTTWHRISAMRHKWSSISCATPQK